MLHLRHCHPNHHHHHHQQQMILCLQQRNYGSDRPKLFSMVAMGSFCPSCASFSRLTATISTAEAPISAARIQVRASNSVQAKPSNVRSHRGIASVVPTKPPVIHWPSTNLGILILSTSVAVAVLAFLAKPAGRAGGSVADLVKRGQLRSDRRSDSKPLKYEDPFNNPMMKMGQQNSVVKMYGKMFRVQAVTLTEEKMLSHQSRRVQAYHWRRPSVFLVEGEPIPDGVDPETIRWIPANHPFATAKTEIDEVAAEKNVYQTRGVPSRVRAEHEALRKRMLEATHMETGVQPPTKFTGMNDEGRRIEKPSQKLLEQLENGFGPRPIKPFDKPDSDSAKLKDSANIHPSNADASQLFVDRNLDG